jgi:hypothetical protein
MWFLAIFQQLGDGISAALPRLVINKEIVMNLKAIIASLVLGSSSLVMASPDVTVVARSQSPYGTTVVRDRIEPAAPQPIYQRETGFWRGDRRLPPVYRPVVLASGMHFSNDGRTFIKVGPQQGRFGTLQISAASGRTFIKQVYVEFENGQSQVIRNLDRMLVGHQTLTLDLDGNRRNIARIVVYGNDMFRGWRRSNGSFTVTAS